MITNPRLYNERSDGSTTVGAYYFNINGNDGFMCDRHKNINQHAANLLCKSIGFSEAKAGNGTGWFQKSMCFITLIFNLG